MQMSQAILPLTMCWSSPCADGLLPGRESESICGMCPRNFAPNRRLPTQMTIRRGNGASFTRRRDPSERGNSGNSPTLWEDRCQLLWRDDLQLIIGTVRRLLIRAPSAELRGVTKPVPLHVVVGHFDDQFRTQWFPRQILALTPAALAARHPLGLLALGTFAFCPCLPWVGCQSILSIGREKVYKLFALRRTEAGAHSDMLQGASTIE